MFSMQSNSRDPERSPMQWSADMNAGFNNKTNITWLPVHPDYKTVNVEVRDYLVKCNHKKRADPHNYHSLLHVSPSWFYI